MGYFYSLFWQLALLKDLRKLQLLIKQQQQQQQHKAQQQTYEESDL